MKRDVIIDWLDLISQQEEGDKVYLVCNTRAGRTVLHNEFKKELKILNEIDTIQGSKIKLTIEAKDGKLWLVLERTGDTPLEGFIKQSGGKVKKVQLKDHERERRIKLMLIEGVHLETVTKLEELTPEEVKHYEK